MAKETVMRIFLAGSTGVIGIRLLPLMVAGGHTVAAMTRTPEKISVLRQAGATAILCDIFDSESLRTAVTEFRPDVVVHQVTDLPDDRGKVGELALANARVRTVGTRNLLAAAQSSSTSYFVAQSIAWPGGAVLEAYENAVIAARGTVLRYGRFYGPGTWYAQDPPPPPRIHIDAAARRTMSFLAGPPGKIIGIAEVEPDSTGAVDTEKENQYARHGR
jgi:hypothetical protein